MMSRVQMLIPCYDFTTTRFSHDEGGVLYSCNVNCPLLYPYFLPFSPLCKNCFCFRLPWNYIETRYNLHHSTRKYYTAVMLSTNASNLLSNACAAALNFSLSLRAITDEGR